MGMGTEVPAYLLTDPRLAVFAGVCAAGACCVTGTAIWQHVTHYVDPVVQRACVRILVMVPVLIVLSLVALIVPGSAVYVEALGGGYEAFILYSFVTLMLAYVGGPVSLVALWHNDKKWIDLVPCGLAGRHGKVKPNRDLLRRIMQGIIQYVVVRTVEAITVILLQAFGRYGNQEVRADRGWVWWVVIQNGSLSVALYSLVLFSKSSRHHMQPYSPLAKFLIIKSILFVTFWQRLVLSILFITGVLQVKEGVSREVAATAINHFFLIVECIPLSLTMFFSFGHKRSTGASFSPRAAGEVQSLRAQAWARNGLGPKYGAAEGGGHRNGTPPLLPHHSAQGVYQPSPDDTPRNVLAAVTHAVDPSDIVRHAMTTFSTIYARNAYHAVELGDRDEPESPEGSPPTETRPMLQGRAEEQARAREQPPTRHWTDLPSWIHAPSREFDT